ncbi:MAG: metalloprotease PmbA [Pseudomonadota bacterium]
MSLPTIPASASVTGQELIEDALTRARTGGADAAEAVVSQDAGLTVTARLRDIETIESQNDRGFSVTVYCQHRKGSASTSDFSPSAIKAAVDKALYIASQTGADECAGLADPELMATDFPDLALDHVWDIDVDGARDLALSVEAAALDADAAVSNSEGATVTTHRGFGCYGNSHGFRGAQHRSSHSLSCSVIAGQGDAMERDYYYTSARNPARLEDPEEVGRLAAERTVQHLGAKKISTRQAPVVFRHDVARSLIGYLLSAISGSAQYRKSSYLLDAVGQTVMAPHLSLLEQPFLPEAPASTAYDREGVATRERAIVADGELQGLVLSSYSARRLGLATTGNAGGVHNALLSHTDMDLPALLRAMDTGLLVTEMMGQGVNLVTGDYSRGAAGFWIENGVIAYPVSEITVAGNLQDMLTQVVHVGGDVDRRGAIQTGSILIDALTIAGS